MFSPTKIVSLLKNFLNKIIFLKRQKIRQIFTYTFLRFSFFSSAAGVTHLYSLMKKHLSVVLYSVTWFAAQT